MSERTCTICDNPALARGLCSKHWQQWRRTQPGPLRTPPPPCSAEGCEEPAIYRTAQLCKGHYNHRRKTGTTDGYTPAKDKPATCTTPGCDEPVRCSALCAIHYERKRNGRPPEGNPIKKGEQSPAWKGDEIRYAAAHRRVKQSRGKASAHPCAECGEPARDWAYSIEAEQQFIDPETNQLFSPNPDDYTPLCRPCHKIYDHRHGLKRSNADQGDAA